MERSLHNLCFLIVERNGTTEAQRHREVHEGDCQFFCVNHPSQSLNQVFRHMPKPGEKRLSSILGGA
jgi:hypothetical protein